MEKERALGYGAGGGGLPPSGCFSGFFSPSESVFSAKCDSSPSAALLEMPELCQFVGPLLESEQFDRDISGLSDFPPKYNGHRRARSEIIGLPDDVSFHGELGVVSAADGPSDNENYEDPFSIYMDMDKLNAACASSSEQDGKASVELALRVPSPNESSTAGPSEKPKVRHQHSLSMDVVTLIKSEPLVSVRERTSASETRKAISAAKLAELALVDPRRAKRIWANRQSAARSKERKMRYIKELEQKVQSLQTESTTMNAQLSILKRDTAGLTAENNELKLRLQTMEQQVQLQDALNNSMRDEVQRLRVATAQVIRNGGRMMNHAAGYGTSQHSDTYALITAQQLQQLRIHPPQQQRNQQVHRPSGDMRNKGTSAPNHEESNGDGWAK